VACWYLWARKLDRVWKHYEVNRYVWELHRFQRGVFVGSFDCQSRYADRITAGLFTRDFTRISVLFWYLLFIKPTVRYAFLNVALSKALSGNSRSCIGSQNRFDNVVLTKIDEFLLKLSFDGLMNLLHSDFCWKSERKIFMSLDLITSNTITKF